MNKIVELYGLNLKTFTEQDVLDYCQINNINSNNITELYLNNNELTDISGVKLFKNLEVLRLDHNQLINISDIKDLNNLEFLCISDNFIKDISVIKNLKNLKELNIQGLELKSDQIQYIKSLKKLKELWCRNGFKDKSVLKQLNKSIKIRFLE